MTTTTIVGMVTRQRVRHFARLWAPVVACTTQAREWSSGILLLAGTTILQCSQVAALPAGMYIMPDNCIWRGLTGF